MKVPVLLDLVPAEAGAHAEAVYLPVVPESEDLDFVVLVTRPSDP